MISLYKSNIHIYIHSSYDETIQRKQSAQYRKRRVIAVKEEVSVTLTIYIHMYIITHQMKSLFRNYNRIFNIIYLKLVIYANQLMHQHD